MKTIETGLVRYDAMCCAIAECHRVDEAKELRDKARAVEVYAKQARNMEAERQAIEIRIRAERRAGQLLKEMKERGERQKVGNPQLSGSTTIETLADLGITRDQSSKWQQLAQIPDGEFEAIFSQPGPKPTTEGVLNAKRAKDAEIPKMDPDALWFWGRLRDFERNEIFERVPDELLALMTDSMRADTLRIVPVLASWLKQIGEQ